MSEKGSTSKKEEQERKRQIDRQARKLIIEKGRKKNRHTEKDNDNEREKERERYRKQN